MKKKTIILLCCVFAALIIAGVIITLSVLPMPLNYPIDKIEPVNGGAKTVGVTAEDDDSVTLQKTTDSPFKVLMFTDMHLDGKNKTSYLTVDRMVKSIQKEMPDLVLLGGDNVTSGNNRKRTHQLAEIFEQLGVYWGGVIGNHEGDNRYSITRTEMVDIFSSYDHCLMRRGPENIDGDCNYAINLLSADGVLTQTVFCLDTFDEIDDKIRESHEIFEDKHYDGAHENQVQWYREKAAALKEQYGDYKSILLQHIPLHAYDLATENGEFLYGDKREDICSTAYENGLFDAIKESGTTTAVFCGHDHLNNFGVFYDGVMLSYIEPSGYGAYGLKKRGAPKSEWLQGYSVLTLLPDGTFSHGQVRYAEVYGDE